VRPVFTAAKRPRAGDAAPGKATVKPAPRNARSRPACALGVRIPTGATVQQTGSLLEPGRTTGRSSPIAPARSTSCCAHPPMLAVAQAHPAPAPSVRGILTGGHGDLSCGLRSRRATRSSAGVPARSILTTLVSERALYAANDSLAATQLAALGNRVTLYRVFGGGRIDGRAINQSPPRHLAGSRSPTSGRTAARVRPGPRSRGGPCPRRS